MDARIKTSIRFLVITWPLLIALVIGAEQAQPKGGLYIAPRAGKCSETILPAQLDGIKPLPAKVLFRVKKEENTLFELPLSLDKGFYTWSGLLAPLGKYTAQLYDATNKELLGEFSFNNIDILENFVKERGELTSISRGGEKTGNENSATNPERKSLLVDNLPKPNGSNKIHIIVVSSRGTKSAEYFGLAPPNRRWESKPLLAGEYRLIVVEYKGDNTCNIVRGM